MRMTGLITSWDPDSNSGTVAGDDGEDYLVSARSLRGSLRDHVAFEDRVIFTPRHTPVGAFGLEVSLTHEECTEDSPCEQEGCSECCSHSDKDAHCCLICGAENDSGAEVDAAQDALEDR